MTHYIIEQFDPKKHDQGRKAFSCGIRAVDNYFQMTAGKLARAEHVRIYVMLSAAQELIGFYALNSHGVRYEELPERYAKNRPGHGYISAGFISMMGRDERFRGNGYGTTLLIDALKRYVQASEILGMPIIMLDVLDCGDPERTARRKALYESTGFQSLESNPSRMFIPIQTVRDALAEAYSSED